MQGYSGCWCVKSISRMGKEVFCEFTDLKEEYDTIDRHKWLTEHEVGGKLLKAVQIFMR